MLNSSEKMEKNLSEFFENGCGKIYDISVPIQPDMPTWPGTINKVDHWFTKSFKKGGKCNVSRVAFSVHTGTHVDAPYHWLQHGARIEEVPIEKLIGMAVVHDLTAVKDHITAKHLKRLDLKKAPICLFKTRNSRLWKFSEFNPDYVYLTPDAASSLITQDVSVVGFDYLSLEWFQSEHAETHRLLLDENIVLVEGLNLECVPPGLYYFVCLPINIAKAEASPARAVLWEISTGQNE